MKITIKTLVEADATKVWNGFDQKLFLKLNPPFPPVKLQRFDGCLTGHQVHLELNFIFFKQCWESLITDHQIKEGDYFFIDEGKQLPFFLSFWKHKHIIRQEGEKTAIVDAIEFKVPFALSWFFYPILWLQFAYRKPIYRQFFR